MKASSQQADASIFPDSYGDTVICSRARPGNSHTRSLPFARSDDGPPPSRRLTHFALLPRPYRCLPLPPSSAFDRRLRSLRLIAVRSNGSLIPVNIVAIVSRPRSDRGEDEKKRPPLPHPPLPPPVCIHTRLLSLCAPASRNRESRGIPPFPHAPISIHHHHSFLVFPFLSLFLHVSISLSLFRSLFFPPSPSRYMRH